MFFTPRIEKRHKRILEIGPGALPHPASDVWLDYDFDEAERYLQSGGEQPASGKVCVFYRGKTFPFRDGAFDYVIASHVLEHVAWDSIPAFLTEMQRVAPAGYIELPRWTYELFFDIDEHMSSGDIRGEKLVLYKKSERSPEWAARRRAVLGAWKPMQDFLAERREFFFCRLEWRNQFEFELRADEYPAADSPEAIEERLRKTPGSERIHKTGRSLATRITNRLRRMIAPRRGIAREELASLLQCPETGSPLDAEYRNADGKTVFESRDGDLRLV